MQQNLDNFFESYLNKESIFKDKSILQLNYIPNEILHRDNEINAIAEKIAPCLRMEKPSNILIYGVSGTGKTLCVRHILTQIELTAERHSRPVKALYTNCKLKSVADTTYRLIAKLSRELGEEVPATGLPTDEIYNTFIKKMEETKGIFIVILDEIDQLVEKAGDNILYNLTRLNTELKNSIITLIGISNNLEFTAHLDSRIKSSLGEEEIIFSPYNAIQMQDILNQRRDKAFREGALEEGVIEKCAAYAARNHGDARRALELLRVAGELAERNDFTKVKIEHLDEAEKKIERDRIFDTVKTLPRQHQILLLTVLQTSEHKKGTLSTGVVYESYRSTCKQLGSGELTQRRVSDIIEELYTQGIVDATVISKGRYGRSRDIRVSLPPSTKKNIQKLLENCLKI